MAARSGERQRLSPRSLSRPAGTSRGARAAPPDEATKLSVVHSRHPPQRRSEVAPEKREPGQAPRREPHRDLCRPQQHEERRVVRNPRARTMPRASAQSPVGRALDPQVTDTHAGIDTRGVAEHPRVDLVDGVPRQPFAKSAARLEALQRVQPRRRRCVGRRLSDVAPSAAMALGQQTTGHAQRRVRLEVPQELLEKAGGQFDIRVEFSDVRVGPPVDSGQHLVQRSRDAATARRSGIA